MRKNFGAKPYTYPQPVLIIATYNENGTADAMNAAWGGISDDTQISMCLSAEHKTVKNILARGAFTVSMADAAHVTECDYVALSQPMMSRINWQRPVSILQRLNLWMHRSLTSFRWR